MSFDFVVKKLMATGHSGQNGLVVRQLAESNTLIVEKDFVGATTPRHQTWSYTAVVLGQKLTRVPILFPPVLRLLEYGLNGLIGLCVMTICVDYIRLQILISESETAAIVEQTAKALQLKQVKHRLGQLKYCITKSIFKGTDGDWSTWSNWSACPETCEKAITRYRERDCNNPLPTPNGKICPGSSWESAFCPECPNMHGKYARYTRHVWCVRYREALLLTAT